MSLEHIYATVVMISAISVVWLGIAWALVKPASKAANSKTASRSSRGHVAAAPPSSMMNSRRFMAHYSISSSAPAITGATGIGDGAPTWNFQPAAVCLAQGVSRRAPGGANAGVPYRGELAVCGSGQYRKQYCKIRVARSARLAKLSTFLS
jgi:hypothetical protein